VVALSASVTETLKDGDIVAVSAAGPRDPPTVKRTIVIAAGTATIRGGLDQAVKLVLNSVGQRLLRAHHTVVARLSATSSGVLVSSRTIVFTAPIAKGGTHGH
jgi:hypothetical protein